MIDAFNSDSSVGGRKGKLIQDHLFVINGIIFDHARSKNKCHLTVAIYDFCQCFDSMWQQDVINDQLAILNEGNKTNNVTVKAPDGISDSKKKS